MALVTLQDCLPADLRGPSTTITRIGAGASGAEIYRVEASGQTYVLKMSGEGESLAVWRGRRQIQQHAADAGLAPRVVHVDEARRAVVSAFVVDRSFPALFANPATHDAALLLLGRTLRRIHRLPLPNESNAQDPATLLGGLWSGLEEQCAMPAFVGDAAYRVLTEEAPPRDRAIVLCHNDVNPTNQAYDGEKLLLLDWETAGPNDPLYDLATISVFLRMDEQTCLRLLEAYDDAPVAGLPARFGYSRRLVAVLCGVMFLFMAHRSGHAGATGEETLDLTPSLLDVYKQIWTGALSIATPEGQWRFGLALIKTSVTL